MVTSRRRRAVRAGARGGLALLGFCVAATGQAQEKNRYDLHSNIGFNLKANFSGLGGFSAPVDPGPATGGGNHTYDDGFNRVDVSGNANGNTWNWAYQNAGQIQGNTVVMSSSSGTASGELTEVRDDPSWGAEFTYARELGSSSSYWWGWAVGIGWQDISIQETARVQTDALRVSDRYSLGNQAAPPAPFTGSFNGPGPLLGDQPTRQTTTIPKGAAVDGQYAIDAALYSVRLGLMYESPFNDHWLLRFGGGGIAGFVDSEFSYTETPVLAGAHGPAQTGLDSTTDLVYGAYGEAAMVYALDDHWRLSAGIQYRYMTAFDQSVNGHQAELDFKNTIFLQIGLGARF